MVTYTYPTEEDKASWEEKSLAIEKRALIQSKKEEVASIEFKNLRKLYDGEDMTAVNAERLKIRNEIKALEGA